MTETVLQKPEWFEKAVEAEFDTLVKNRRTLHTMPELGNQEYKTQQFITDYLNEVGVDVVHKGYKHSKTAVIGVINPEKGDTVALRADIDALPIKENTGLPFASEARGLMWGKEVSTAHMCGHDGHISMLLTAAKILAEHKEEIARRVVLIFQPAEEGDSLENPMEAEVPADFGASLLVNDGLIEEFDIKHVFGMHVDGVGVPGRLEITSGVIMNSADSYQINLTGKQSHGAMPWMGVDTALMTAQTVVSLQQIVSRNVNLTKGMGVVTVGKMTAGDTVNVVTGKGCIIGTVRTNNPEIQELILKRIPEVADGVAAAHGGKAETRVHRAYPMTINDDKLTARTVSNLQSWGVNAIASTKVWGASEDFSCYAQKVPSLFMFLSVGWEGKDPMSLHSDRFILNEEALKTGVKAHVAAAFGCYKNL